MMLWTSWDGQMCGQSSWCNVYSIKCHNSFICSGQPGRCPYHFRMEGCKRMTLLEREACTLEKGSKCHKHFLWVLTSVRQRGKTTLCKCARKPSSSRQQKTDFTDDKNEVEEVINYWASSLMT